VALSEQREQSGPWKPSKQEHCDPADKVDVATICSGRSGLVIADDGDGEDDSSNGNDSYSIFDVLIPVGRQRPFMEQLIVGQ